MGDVTDLAAYRARGAARTQAAETAGAPVRAEVYFDLASPFTYLAAERVHRAFGTLAWIPACSRVLRHDTRSLQGERRAADARAARCGSRSSGPSAGPWTSRRRCGQRVTRPPRVGRPSFVIAASRLAWAGGFDLDDPARDRRGGRGREPPAGGVAAGGARRGRDAAIEAAAHAIAAAGADRLPAFRVGRAVFAGEDRHRCRGRLRRVERPGGRERQSQPGG
jgi:hypothetical protein